MNTVRSPLGALGALMVLLEGIAAAALIPLKSQPGLQTAVVIMMVASIGLLTILVIGMIALFAWKRPGLLFNPRDIDPSVHPILYGAGEAPNVPPPQSVSLVVRDEESQGQN